MMLTLLPPTGLKSWPPYIGQLITYPVQILYALLKSSEFELLAPRKENIYSHFLIYPSDATYQGGAGHLTCTEISRWAPWSQKQAESTNSHSSCTAGAACLRPFSSSGNWCQLTNRLLPNRCHFSGGSNGWANTHCWGCWAKRLQQHWFVMPKGSLLLACSRATLMFSPPHESWGWNKAKSKQREGF